MPRCFDCNSEFKSGDAFCSNCGKSLRSKRLSGENKPVDNYPQKPKPRFPHDDLSVSMRKQTQDRLDRGLTLAGCIGVVTFFAIYIGIVSKSWAFPLIMLAINFFVPAYMINRNRTYHEYYMLPGSKIDGQHRCIFCGHKGVYKKGEYRTNNVIASCTGCNAFLYKTTN